MTPTSAPSDPDKNAHVAFFLGEEEYAVPLARVVEVAADEALTRIPGAPPFLRGVVDVRGRPVPVIDLPGKFGTRDERASVRERLLVVRAHLSAGHDLIALVADRMSDVLELGPADIEPVPSLSSGIRAEFLAGMTRRDERRFVLLLDLDRVLTATEQEALAGHLADATPATSDSPADSEPSAPATPEAAAEMRRFVAVQVAGQRCGIDASWIREATPWDDVTFVPGASSSVRGLVNLRGTVLPVFDLAAALGQAAVTPHDRSAFLILDPPDDSDRGSFGLAVESILGIVEGGGAPIETLPVFASPLPSGRIEGAVLAGAASLLVVNLTSLLAATTDET